MKTKYIIFDLDDTLIYEIDFLKSAYKEIAEKLDKRNQQILFQKMLLLYEEGENVFKFLTKTYSKFTKYQLLLIYRNHFPIIKLNEGALELLNVCKSKGYKLGLITDGRSVTQRNKLKALEIEELFDKIIISEEFGSTKPDDRNFNVFIQDEISEYFYIADNPIKDFVIPNRYGWTSICLKDKGYNVHLQQFDKAAEFKPKICVETLKEVIGLI